MCAHHPRKPTGRVYRDDVGNDAIRGFRTSGNVDDVEHNEDAGGDEGEGGGGIPPESFRPIIREYIRCIPKHAECK